MNDDKSEPVYVFKDGDGRYFTGFCFQMSVWTKRQREARRMTRATALNQFNHPTGGEFLRQRAKLVRLTPRAK